MEVTPPRFILGHAVVVGYLAIGLFGGSVLHYVLLRRENGKRLNGGRNVETVGNSYSQLALMGDMR